MAATLTSTPTAHSGLRRFASTPSIRACATALAASAVALVLM